MLSVRRVVRDYEEAGSLNGLLAPWGFVDDHTFITKAGHVGLVYRVSGVDYECLDQTQRRDVVHRFEAALRLLDDSCRVYQYMCKRRIEPVPLVTRGTPVVSDAILRHAEHLNASRHELYEIELYLVLLSERLQQQRPTSTRLRGLRNPRRAVREWLSTRTICSLFEAEAFTSSVGWLHEVKPNPDEILDLAVILTRALDHWDEARARWQTDASHIALSAAAAELAHAADALQGAITRSPWLGTSALSSSELPGIWPRKIQ
jgi:hypothetical protein